MHVSCLLLLAIAGAASASTGPLLMSCRDGWNLFLTRNEASCMKLMHEPELFDDAFEACHKIGARLLSFSHRMDKVFHINNMIVNIMKDNAALTTLWFFDPMGMGRRMAKDENGEPKPDQWMVISPNEDKSKIEIMPNATAIKRNFICEAPAHPSAQRAQFLMEPEHLFIADFQVKTAETEEETDKDDETKQRGPERRPLIVTFNCQTYGMPKPTVEWRLIHKADNQSLLSEPINARIIHNPREPMKHPVGKDEVAFFNLQRDCGPRRCPEDGIQERSQLVVVNPQFMDLNKRIVCVARNEFGSVLSQEAPLLVTSMEEFANKEETVTVKAGMSAIISNDITTKPDAASAECFRINKRPGGPVQRIPLEQLNRMTHGAIQMSKATFDIIIDAARDVDAGEFLCEARLQNGRMGHVIRKKTINLKVETCDKADGCDLESKPVAVADGYPAVLSMNPFSNSIIRAGDDFMLECPCTGKRRPEDRLTVQWNLRNRTDLPVVAIPVLPRGSALLLRRADYVAHSGRYFCQCERGEEKSEWKYVDVEVMPPTEPLNRPEIRTAKLGEKVTFECRVDTHETADLGVFVEPIRGIQTLADFIANTGSSHIKIQRSNATHAVFSFDEVKETDAGIYGCRVTSNYGQWAQHNTYYTTLVVEK